MYSEAKKQTAAHNGIFKSVKALNVETDTCNAKAMALNRRIEEIDKMVGSEEV